MVAAILGVVVQIYWFPHTLDDPPN